MVFADMCASQKAQYEGKLWKRLRDGLEEIWEHSPERGSSNARRFDLDPDTASIIEAEAKIIAGEWMLYRSGVDTDKNPLEQTASTLSNEAEIRLSNTPIRTPEAAAAVARFLEGAVYFGGDERYQTAMQNLRDYLEGGKRSFNPHCEM